MWQEVTVEKLDTVLVERKNWSGKGRRVSRVVDMLNEKNVQHRAFASDPSLHYCNISVLFKETWCPSMGEDATLQLLPVLLKEVVYSQCFLPTADPFFLSLSFKVWLAGCFSTNGCTVLLGAFLLPSTSISSQGFSIWIAPVLLLDNHFQSRNPAEQGKCLSVTLSRLFWSWGVLYFVLKSLSFGCHVVMVSTGTVLVDFVWTAIIFRLRSCLHGSFCRFQLAG